MKKQMLIGALMAVLSCGALACSDNNDTSNNANNTNNTNNTNNQKDMTSGDMTANDMSMQDMNKQDMAADQSTMDETGDIPTPDMSDMVGDQSGDMTGDMVEDMKDMGQGDGDRLRLATWNIYYLDLPGQGDRIQRTQEDYDRLKKYVTRLEADVVALQEVHGKEAVHTLFPEAQWEVVCEDRNSRQNVCIALKKGLPWSMTKNPDVTELQAGNPNLRNGLDITLNRTGYPSVRVLSVHMKADCFFGMNSGGCATFFTQIKAMETWIDARANANEPYIVMGDFNRFMTDDDEAWKEIDDSDPANADLTRSIAAGNTPCWNNMFSNFIDHIILDTTTVQWLKDSQQLVFDETDFDAFYEKLSDHCPLWADLEIPPNQ